MPKAKSAKKLSLNLKKFRKLRHLSQGDISRSLSVDRSYISNIEAGRMNPTLTTLEKLAGALSVSVGELLN